MKIVVLIKAVHRDPGSTEALPWLGPCDHAALCTALALARPEDSLVAVTAGPRSDEICLQLALKAGMPRAVRLWDPSLEQADLRTVCGLTSGGLYKLGCDLILTGQRSADWGSGALGPALAHFLGVPHVTSVIGAEIRDGKLYVDHLREEEIVSLQVEPPALLAIAEGPPRTAPELAELPRVEVMDLEDTTLRIPKFFDGPVPPEPVEGGKPALLSNARALLLELKNAGLVR